MAHQLPEALLPDTSALGAWLPYVNLGGQKQSAIRRNTNATGFIQLLYFFSQSGDSLDRLS